ncbi:MAG: hypothetical protein ABIS45_10595 [Burkholderiales bacterium]
MRRFAIKTTAWTTALILASVFACAPALADKPEWNEHGKGGKFKKEKKEKKEKSHEGNRGGDDREVKHFDDRHREHVREYYGEQFRGGRCPPGLAKKHNGCMPPGQAKKWVVGRPLPRDVVYYEVPQPLVARIGPPPSGYRYVRVASDILMIAIGTKLVVDAIQNLGGG